MYDLNNNLDSSYNSHGFESNARNSANSTSGSTALYHHNGSRFGLGIPGRSNGPNDKLNSLHGAKHKRGDMDRECKFTFTSLQRAVTNAVDKLTALQALVLRICKARSLLFARISTAAGICRRSWKKVLQNTAI